MKNTTNFLKEVKKLIIEKDLDWINIIVGGEGIGKSTLAIIVCMLFDSKFSVDNIVFSTEELVEQIKKSYPGMAILIDEGALMFFTRDAMSKETKRGVRIMTGIRGYNLFLIVNIPNFWILDKYMREHRVKSVMRVVKRGWFWYFGPKKVKMITRDKKKNYKTVWPDWDYRDSFPKEFNEDFKKIWGAYLEKKKKLIVENEDGIAKKKGKKNTQCIRCNYQWFYSGSLENTLCPSCRKLTPTHNLNNTIVNKENFEN